MRGLYLVTDRGLCGGRALEDVVMFGDVYAGRRVFVTGHTGFKGAWLTLWLLDLGANVTGYALEPPTKPNLFEAIGLDRCAAQGAGLGGSFKVVFLAGKLFVIAG